MTSGPLLGYFVSEWNRKIYRNEDGSAVEGNIGSEEFWDEFQIKSWPKFRDACAFHVPGKWADDVRKFIIQVQTELGDKVKFAQIKEKFCQLTVYSNCVDKKTEKRLYELKKKCVDSLIKKGVHPPIQEKKNEESE